MIGVVCWKAGALGVMSSPGTEHILSVQTETGGFFFPSQEGTTLAMWDLGRCPSVPILNNVGQTVG